MYCLKTHWHFLKELGTGWIKIEEIDTHTYTHAHTHIKNRLEILYIYW